MGNGTEEASRDCEVGIEATRRADGRRGPGQSRRTHREDGRLGCGSGPDNRWVVISGPGTTADQRPVLGPGPSNE